MAVTADEDYQGSYGPEWARAANTTLIESFKDVPELMLRSTPVLAMIQHRGNVETNVSGRGWQRSVQYRLHPEQPSTGTSPRSFAPTNLWKRITLERRYIDITDSITKPERNSNEGANAIVPVFKRMAKNLRKSGMQKFARHVYKDGDAAGETGWHGYNSFAGHDQTGTVSQSIDQTSAGAPSASGYVSRNVNVADPFMLPSDTYCGLSTALGNYGGRQLTGIWPDGEANEWLDFHSPLLVNSNTTFRGPIGSGQTGWQTNCVELLSLGVSMANRNMLSSPLDLVVMKQMQFDELKNALRTKERVNVTSSASILRSYGFSSAQAIEVDGLEIAVDYFAANIDTYRSAATATSVPAIYGFCTGCWHVASAYDGLWDFDEPFYDIDTKATKFAADADGNFWNESVRGSVLWAPFSATS